MYSKGRVCILYTTKAAVGQLQLYGFVWWNASYRKPLFFYYLSFSETIQIENSRLCSLCKGNMVKSRAKQTAERPVLVSEVTVLPKQATGEKKFDLDNIVSRFLKGFSFQLKYFMELDKHQALLIRRIKKEDNGQDSKKDHVEAVSEDSKQGEASQVNLSAIFKIPQAYGLGSFPVPTVSSSINLPALLLTQTNNHYKQPSKIWRMQRNSKGQRLSEYTNDCLFTWHPRSFLYQLPQRVSGLGFLMQLYKSDFVLVLFPAESLFFILMVRDFLPIKCFNGGFKYLEDPHYRRTV